MSDCFHTLMAGVPTNIDTSMLLRQLKQIPDVLDVHDLHVWALSGNKVNVWAHLTVESGADTTQILYAAQDAATRIGCNHTCFQLEDAKTYDRSVEGAGCFHP
eukprot:CAMPEP_0115866986 /NCGR_PEP_ID=MMETSP0287-20121206/20535_1 /TAXON_ID=412157 /ORGANISM="Chrysochromulina rotalis, Strain UIO044" /LENGTH=102 /DNA_ID=CAMNT_0003321577 /DNA_START=171 /DNA_END=479 /DNA_ORIENTATION=+